MTIILLVKVYSCIMVYLYTGNTAFPGQGKIVKFFAVVHKQMQIVKKNHLPRKLVKENVCSPSCQFSVNVSRKGKNMF